jgi:putative membrane-bound dehydrogenase-like protein
MRNLCVAILTTLAPLALAAPTTIIDLDAESPYYPHRSYPKLTTPQWVGEAGVDAVVILAIDDMRDHRRYETFFRPILERLKKIDPAAGRAPLSIMTCKIDPQTPQLQEWLKEGLNFEIHTVEHPCPILAGNDFERAKSTYDRCVDQLFQIPDNHPVAFRTPCCDSLNTPSPRLYTEIFNKTTANGHFLSIDSSVFNITTANDPELPRAIVFDQPGRERFGKYVPFESFVNTIEDYPYPYVMGRLCWQFPCATPSDWQAQYVHKPANPITTADWKALLDATVIKRGVMTMVFHPYGWSTADMFVELIDHATAKYGKRVKFLNFREADERLRKNLGHGIALRDDRGADAGLRLIDINRDGYLDVVFTREHKARIWDPAAGVWKDAQYPAMFAQAEALATGAPAFLKDIDHDGTSELIVGRDVFAWTKDGQWQKRTALPAPLGGSTLLVDLDEDGVDDFISSNLAGSRILLFTDFEQGWTRRVLDVPANDPAALPPIARADGSNNGAFVHSRHLWWQNEDTAKLPNLVDRRSFNALLKDVEPRPKSPAAALASMQVAPGYRIELAASEPQVQDPIAFAFGPDGKLWVVEMPDYPLGIDGKGKIGGRVKYLEDTDGDGVYEKSTLFLDGLRFPTSVLPWKNGVLVTAAPDLFYAQDTDGDGKADRREVLFTGFKEGNQQHRVNHLSFGLDNWIYGANGDSGGTIKSLKTGREVSISGRDFRFRPDTGEFEAIAGQSQFGRSRDDAGDYFGCNNSNPLWHFPLSEHYLKRNPHVPPPAGAIRIDVPKTPGAAPVFPISITRARFNNPESVNHFTSACSAHIYRDDLLIQSAVAFISEPVHNLVHREIVSPAGFTFTSDRATSETSCEFLASSDNWFRPTTVAAGPDGALYVADMYRAVIEHPEWIPKDWQARLDLRAGHDKGRIYRIVPVGVPRRPVPRLDRLDTAGLDAALDSPSGWQRDLAQWMLQWRNDPAAIAPLERTLRESKNPLARLHALCTLGAIGSPKSESLLAGVNDADAAVRRHALRLAEARLNESPQLQDSIPKLAEDKDAQVRLQLAYSLGYWDDDRAANLLARLATDPATGDDRILLAAVVSSLNAKNIRSVSTAVTATAESRPPSPPLLAGLLRTALGTKNTAAIAATLTSFTSPRGDTFAAWQYQTLANFLDSLDSAGASLKKLADADKSMSAAVESVAAVVRSARQAASDERAPLDRRAAAVALLGRDSKQQSEDAATFDRLLSPQSPRELQAATIATMARRRDAQSAKRLLDHWKGLSPDLRAAAVDSLLARTESANLFLDAIGGKQVLAIEVDAPRRQRLLQFPNEGVRNRASGLFAASVNPDRQKVLDAFADVMILKGDPKRGAEIFKNTCATCHRFGQPPIGNAVGPDLASVGDKSTQGLLIAILDPNRAVEPRYINYIATTTDNDALTGLLASESATSITLLGPDAKPQTLRRQDLKDLRSSNSSLMPEGLEANLKPQDLADLIGYIRTPG